MNYTETITDNEGHTVQHTAFNFTNGDHTPTDVTTPAREIIVRVTGTFIPASRHYVGIHRKV